MSDSESGSDEEGIQEEIEDQPEKGTREWFNTVAVDERNALRRDIERCPSRERQPRGLQRGGTEDWDLWWQDQKTRPSATDRTVVNLDIPMAKTQVAAPGEAKHFFGGKSRQEFWELTAA